jgi:Ca2+-binding EF-hand superfamily protein
MHVQFKSWFDRFDKEHSGTIDKREFVAFLK